MAGVAFYVYANYVSSCTPAMSYSIGSIDPRFGISLEDFAEISQDVELVWESPFNKEFFQYDPASEFKINLIFDDRQQRTIDEKNIRTEIGTQEQIYRSKVNQYEVLHEEHKNLSQAYDAQVSSYDQRLKKYNDEVAYWNQNGGAPNNEYTRLQREKNSLQREASDLEQQRRVLNQKVAVLNSLAAEINDMAKRLNLDVDAYNGKFGVTREFDQGNFTGEEINIYQFSEAEDLRLVLAHEFGHALGIDHVNDPQAVMYYLMDKQNIKNLQLSPADKDAVRGACGIRS
jgi:hypothetical protein